MARAGAALLRDADLLVLVPLHRARLFKRRYNQAALLAAAVGRIAGVPAVLDGPIWQRRRSRSITVPAERAAELRGAFAIRPKRAGRLAGRSVRADR